MKASEIMVYYNLILIIFCYHVEISNYCKGINHNI